MGGRSSSTRSGMRVRCHPCSVCGRAAATSRQSNASPGIAAVGGDGVRHTRKRGGPGRPPLAGPVSRCGVSTVSPSERYADLLSRSSLWARNALCSPAGRLSAMVGLREPAAAGSVYRPRFEAGSRKGRASGFICGRLFAAVKAFDRETFSTRTYCCGPFDAKPLEPLAVAARVANPSLPRLLRISAWSSRPCGAASEKRRLPMQAFRALACVTPTRIASSRANNAEGSAPSAPALGR
jgi:hypothetical protein